MRKILTSVFVASSLSVFSITAAAQVENVVGLVITDPAAQVEIMDAWLSTDDSDAGQKVTLLATVFNGSDDATHTIVADFPDYESWEDLNARRGSSAAWAQQTRASAGVSTTVSESLMLRVADNGETWNEGDFLAVIPIEVTGRGSSPIYVSAFEEMMGSDLGEEAPGLVRLVAGRSGSPTSHVVLITAPTFSALNEYLDSFPETEGFQNFVSKVDEISRPVGGQMLRVVRVWE